GRLHNTPTRENPAGELGVDGQLAAARKLGVNADFAMTNTGGVRADLVVEPDRTITWGAAQAVQPFGNILRVVE
ncbi:5'-nucleotidase C-terminal domain-containing protein, partial [Bifidobacterium pseudocatenulatum]|nr:5'-nucleotidase C-terminal domain-containing protein [Bifidobacterium pseudocatenulatum]